MIKTLLAIPVYNCEKQILRVLDSIKKYKYKFNEIIFIENNSSDNTLKNIINYTKANNFENTSIFQNENNINLGGSHINIFNHFLNSNNDQLLVMHGDDQGDIEDYISIENPTEDFSWIKFSRFHPNSKLIGYSNLKKIGNQVFNLLFSIVLKKRIYDIGSGLDLYNKSFISKIPYQNFPLNLTFDYYMIIYGLFKTEVKFYPQKWKDEDQVSNVRLFNQSVELLKIFFEYCYFSIIRNQDKFFSKNRNNFDKIYFNKKKI